MNILAYILMSLAMAGQHREFIVSNDPSVSSSCDGCVTVPTATFNKPAWIQIDLLAVKATKRAWKDCPPGLPLGKCWDGTYQQMWTCADKSRILLTAENGTRHCVRLP